MFGTDDRGDTVRFPYVSANAELLRTRAAYLPSYLDFTWPRAGFGSVGLNLTDTQATVADSLRSDSSYWRCECLRVFEEVPDGNGQL